ncbi:MAG: AraC family transcriptional regulator, partial [Spirochaetota bacterium]
LTAIEDRLIRSLLRGRLPSADEAADELLLAWGSAGTDCPRRLRVFAFALAREAERYVSVGGMIDHITLALAPDSLVGGGGVRRALAELLMAWTGSLATEGEDPGRRIIDWLSETPAHELSLDALAQRLRCSTASASRLFKEATGRSFAAYAGELRLERAVALVSGEGAELTLEELARKVGYSDSAYFGRLFKEHTGMSPREFARSARGGRQEVPRL